MRHCHDGIERLFETPFDSIGIAVSNVEVRKRDYGYLSIADGLVAFEVGTFRFPTFYELLHVLQVLVPIGENAHGFLRFFFEDPLVRPDHLRFYVVYVLVRGVFDYLVQS